MYYQVAKITGPALTEVVTDKNDEPINYATRDEAQEALDKLKGKKNYTILSVEAEL